MKDLFDQHNEHEFRRRMQGHEFNVVPGAWDKLAEQLDAQKPQRRGLGWWWSSLLLGLGMGVVGLGYWAWQGGKTETGSETTTPAVKTQEQSPAKQPSKGQSPSQLPLAQQEVQNPAATNNSKPSSSLTKASAYRNFSTPTKTPQEQGLAQANLAQEQGASLPETKEQNLHTAQHSPLANAQDLEQQQPSLAQSLSKMPDLPLVQPNFEQSFVQTEPQLEPLSLQSPKKRRWQLGLILGGSAKKYKTGDYYSSSLVAGAELAYRIKGNHGVSIGAQYKNIGQKQNLFQATQAQEDYALLMAFHPVYVTNSKFNRVYYHLSRIDMLETFAQYQYQIHPHWQLSAGLRVGILLQSLTNDPNKKSYSLSEQGLAHLDFGLTWGVDWKINRHWSLGLQYGQGLRNLSKGAEDKINALNADTGMPTFENPTADLALPNDPANVNVLVEQGNDYQNFVRIPIGLRNTDFQLLLKFRF